MPTRMSEIIVYSHSPCTLRDQSEVNCEAGPEASQIVLSVEQKTPKNITHHHCPVNVQSKQDIREPVSDLKRAGGSNMDGLYCANSIFLWFLDLLLYCNDFWSLCTIRSVMKNTLLSLWSRTKTPLISSLQFAPNLYLRENIYSEMSKEKAEKGLIQNTVTAPRSYLLVQLQESQASHYYLLEVRSLLDSVLALWTPPHSIYILSVWQEAQAFPNTFPAHSTPPHVMQKTFEALGG